MKENYLKKLNSLKAQNNRVSIWSKINKKLLAKNNKSNNKNMKKFYNKL